MAEAFGRQLLADVEVVGFDELLDSLRSRRETQSTWFNCTQIDGILQNVTKKIPPPIIEIASTGTGAGKTHLTYLLASLAVLPSQHGGKDGCIVIIDADGSFSVDRLAIQIKHRLITWSSDLDVKSLEAITRSALHHVYIYKPQSMRGLVMTLSSLPEYFLHDNHYSLDRCMSFIAIDSASAFYWQTKAEEENAAFTTSMQSSATSSQPPTTYVDLRKAVESASKALQCPVVITSRHIGKLPKTVAGELPRALRPSLPSPFAQLPILRLLVRRVPVRKLPSGLSIIELVRENVDRAKVVSLSRFECVVDEFGLSVRDVQALRAAEDGFHFRIKADGVVIEVPSNGHSERVDDADK